MLGGYKDEGLRCEGLVSPILVENVCHLNQDLSIAGHFRPKSPRIENSFLESLRASLKEEIASEIKSLLVESQREMLKLLKPKTGENVKENIEEETENETRNFYTPTKSVRINSTQNDDPSTSRNKHVNVSYFKLGNDCIPFSRKIQF